MCWCKLDFTALKFVCSYVEFCEGRLIKFFGILWVALILCRVSQMFLKNLLYIWLFKTVNCVHMFEKYLYMLQKKTMGVLQWWNYGNANMVSKHKQTDSYVFACLMLSVCELDLMNLCKVQKCCILTAWMIPTQAQIANSLLTVSTLRFCKHTQRGVCWETADSAYSRLKVSCAG